MLSRIPRNALLAAAALLVFVAVAVAVDLQIVLQAHSTQTVWAVTHGDPVDVDATVNGRTRIVGRHLLVETTSGNNYSVWVPAGDEPAWITLQANNVALFAAQSSGVGVPDTQAQNISDAISTLSGGTVSPGSATASPSPSPTPSPSPSPRKT